MASNSSETRWSPKRSYTKYAIRDFQTFNLADPDCMELSDPGATSTTFSHEITVCWTQLMND